MMTRLLFLLVLLMAPAVGEAATYSSYIPTGKDGHPVLTKCLVCVPDALPVPADGKFFAKEEAVLSIKGRDASIDVTKFKVPGAAAVEVIRGA